MCVKIVLQPPVLSQKPSAKWRVLYRLEVQPDQSQLDPFYQGALDFDIKKAAETNELYQAPKHV